MLSEDIKVCSFYFCTYVLCTAVYCIPEKTIKVFFFFNWLMVKYRSLCVGSVDDEEVLGRYIQVNVPVQHYKNTPSPSKSPKVSSVNTTLLLLLL